MNNSTLNGSIVRNFILALLLAALLSACMVGPDYRRPAVDAPKAWRFGVTEAHQISNVVWWDQFHDPALSNLVRTALKNNMDLEIATANVDQAAAQYGITRSAQFPQVNAGASASRQRLSQNDRPWAAGRAGQPFNDYGVNLSASFELDVWGKLRRATESARASLLASEEGRRTVVLTVVSTVAERLHPAAGAGPAARDRAAHFAELWVKQRGCSGCASRKVRCPRATTGRPNRSTEAAAAQVPELERQIARQENFISVLLGRNPGPIQRGRRHRRAALPRGA